MAIFNSKLLVYQRVHPIITRGHHPLTSLPPGCQERMRLQARDPHLRAQITSARWSMEGRGDLYEKNGIILQQYNIMYGKHNNV